MSRHNLPLAWQSATDMSAIGWGVNYIQFKLFHKPIVAGLNRGRGQHNKTTLLYVTTRGKICTNYVDRFMIQRCLIQDHLDCVTVYSYPIGMEQRIQQ